MSRERVYRIRCAIERASRHRWLPPWQVEALARRIASKCSTEPERTLWAVGIPGPLSQVGAIGGCALAHPWQPGYAALVRTLKPFHDKPAARLGCEAELAVLSHLIKEKTGWPRLSLSRLRSFEARSAQPSSSS